MREKRKSLYKFGGAKAGKAEQVRKYFVNPKMKMKFSAGMYITLFVVWISEMQMLKFEYPEFIDAVHFFRFRREKPFLGKFGSNCQYCQF